MIMDGQDSRLCKLSGADSFYENEIDNFGFIKYVRNIL